MSEIIRKSLFIIILIILSSQLLAYSLADSTDWNTTLRYLTKYCTKNVNNADEKHIQQQIKYFLKILENKKIEKSIKEAKLYLHDIKIRDLQMAIKQFADSLQNKKNEYNIYREIKSILGDSIIYHFDEQGISSDDSSFEDLLDYISDPNNKDTIKVEVKRKEKKWQTTYFSDSLIFHVREMLTHVQTDSVFVWLKEQQNDTLDLYITDINNDSIPLRLYPNSSQIIPVDIADFWGREVPALIKDIGANTFKLIIDDSPHLRLTGEEQIKNILKGQNNIYELRNTIQMKKREVPNLLCPWRFYGNASLDATQILLHQWNKGGQSSIAFLANAELYLKYNQGKHNLDSYAKFKLGLIRQGYYTDSKAYFKTNSDIIDIQAKYGYETFGKKILTTLFANFKTQFAPAYEYPSDTQKILVSKFFNPARITFALGFNYKPKNANLFFSPLSAKTTLVKNSQIDKAKYGLKKGKTSRQEIGAIFKGYMKNAVWGNITMENTLELFSNYIKNPENVDISWDLRIIFPINDYIKTTLSTSFIYDDDEIITKTLKDGEPYKSKGGQFKQMLMIGFYTFF